MQRQVPKSTGASKTSGNLTRGQEKNNYDLLYKNECQNWRNKINRVKNTAGFPADRLEKIQVAFSDFKKEALREKKAVKTGNSQPERIYGLAVSAK